MRTLTTLIAAAALAAGCSKEAPPAAGPVDPSAGAPAATPAALVAPPDAAAPAHDDHAGHDHGAPAPGQPAPTVTYHPANSEPLEPTSQMLSADEARELERRPGATPALPHAELPAAPPVAGYPGAPGPAPKSGPDDALVRVVFFSDFQCPVCRRAAEPVKQLRREFGDDVQIVWMHNALTSHRRATPAALAAIAAHRQQKFWEFHDVVFENAANLEDADLEHYAGLVGLDLDRFKKDLADPTAAAQVDYERAVAEALGAPGTPSYFVNGMKSVGWGSYFGLRSQVERAIAQAKADVDAGTPRAEVAVKRTVAMGEEGAKLAKAVFGTR